MIVGISGKKGSGKDTIANMIEYITTVPNPTFTEYERRHINNNERLANSRWVKKKFADKLKDIVCLLIGCTREQLEDAEFKEKPLGEEWISYRVAKGFWSHSDGNPSHKMMESVQCDKETYEAERRINWQTAYKTELTPRILLQRIGTDLFRDLLHKDVWVNATFADYNPVMGTVISTECPAKSWNDISESDEMKYGKIKPISPKWLITDLRFPNEFSAVKERGGITIRITTDRANSGDTHESETALDGKDEDFDYHIRNDSSYEYLFSLCKSICDAENLYI